MATGTNARQFHQQMIHYLRKSFSYEDTGKVLTVGTLPAGALILKPLSGVQVNEAFTAGTNKQIDIGTAANDDLFGTDLSLAAIAFVPLDEAVDMVVAADTVITATPDLTGATNTAGKGVIVIAYLADNDQ